MSFSHLNKAALLAFTSLLLIVVSHTVPASAVTIGEGVIINISDNITLTVDTSITADNFTFESDQYFLIENDNISLESDTSGVEVNITTWTSPLNNQFYITGSGAITYNITSSGLETIIVYKNADQASPFTLSGPGYWSYYLTSNSTFYFRDQETLSLITENITLELISDLITYTYYTTTGKITQDIVNGDYEARYSSSSYDRRTSIQTISEDFNTTYYLINSTDSDNVTITIYDLSGEVVPRALVKASKYYVTNNTYIEQESSYTNDNGQTTMRLTLYDEYYRFTVQLDGVTLKITTPQYLTSTSLSITVDTGTGIGEDYERYLNIDYSLVYNDNTNNFRLEYNDVNSEITNMCLYLYRLTATSKTLVDSSCSSSSTATILLSVTPANGTFYEAIAKYTYEGVEHELDRESKSWASRSKAGQLGLLMQVIITGGILLTGYLSIPVMFVLAPASILFGQVVGLNELNYSATIPILIVGIALALWYGRRDGG